MDKIFYGNGVCAVESGNLRGVFIRYSGNVLIKDRTEESFVLIAKNNIIMIFPIGTGYLSNLFEYEGNFQILTARFVNSNQEQAMAAVSSSFDYAQYLYSNAEDLTRNSEDLNVTYTSIRNVEKTTLEMPILANLSTSDLKSNLYLPSGEIYSGYYHVHLEDNVSMTGREHTKDSLVLNRSGK